MRKRPVVSGEKLLKVLVRLGYEIIRQRGSHVRLKKETAAGDHNITVPLHDELAKGTLNDILSQVSIWNGISEDALIEMIKQS
ncbi:MAG: type II toxin-antitoxin system HicA family toxin [Methanothrix sp.]|nr:type II toxin-antitoxin system HicA family toxin [Methanothrix sp.]